ncbi:MAG TPA: isoprenylcysteine carboxylmethyltransferase family protein [Candidatus Acidoferrum sp.]|nr:isoprenylcysteine carboxylmethyltransferase family protein [Candidatus Acidoferrum sp.]HTZ83926.1 isoprenylcysteine carboxylmethyltransferase family protein [Candidatus Acidoferrales bacterium]
MAEWSRIARRIRVPLGFAFVVLYFWLAHPTWKSLALGEIFIVPGLLVRALASGHVKKNEALATTGPYAYTRNPLYLGSLLIGIGFAIAARSWRIGIVLVVMFFAIYVPVILSEEAFLREQFPEFDDYTRRVPRMLPRIIPARTTADGRGFSLNLYLKHREWNALLGAVGIVAVLIAKMMLFH